MSLVTKLVLDVLKPHQPDAITFAKAIADIAPSYQVHLVVMEMDEKTETLQLEICASDLDFEAIQNTLRDLGGSLHSIDEVEVINIDTQN